MYRTTQCNWCFDISTKAEPGKTCQHCHHGTMLETVAPIFRNPAPPYKSRFVKWIMDDRPPRATEAALCWIATILVLIALFGN